MKQRKINCRGVCALLCLFAACLLMACGKEPAVTKEPEKTWTAQEIAAFGAGEWEAPEACMVKEVKYYIDGEYPVLEAHFQVTDGMTEAYFTEYCQSVFLAAKEAQGEVFVCTPDELWQYTLGKACARVEDAQVSEDAKVLQYSFGYDFEGMRVCFRMTLDVSYGSVELYVLGMEAI